MLEEFQNLDKNGKYQKILLKFETISSKDLAERDYNFISYIAAKANFLLGKVDETLKLLHSVILWAKENDNDLFISSTVLDANCYTSKGEHKNSQKIFERLFSEAKNIDQLPYYPALLINYGHTLFYQGAIIKATEQYEEALKVSKERGLPDDKILNNLALAYNQLGKHNEAIETALEVIRKKEELEDWHGWTIAKANLSTFYSCINNFEEAHKMVDEALQFAENKYFKRELAGAYSAKGAILIREKRVLEAYDNLRRSRNLLENAGIKDILPEALVRLGFVSILLGYYQEAEEIIEKLCTMAAKQESYYYFIWSTCLEALLHYNLEKTEQALEIMGKAMNIALEFSLFNVYFQTACLSSYIYAADNQFEEVGKIAEKALEIAKQQNNEINRIKFSLTESFLQVISGKEEKFSELNGVFKYLKEKEQFFTEDIEKLNEFIEELIEEKNTVQKLIIRAKAERYLVNYLQRVNPWF
ncbi:MAG: tetratricopeptide repeat protein [Candidatus Heimdallarchaeaceae archaeon]